MITFVVPGQPQGKGRARSTSAGRHYTPAKTVAYEGLVAWSAQAAMGGAKPLEGPLEAEIEAVYAIPASWSRKRREGAIAGLERPTVKPDIDNILKAIGDGGNGVAWNDDVQIVTVTGRKRYGLTPQVVVTVRHAEAAK